MELGWGLSKLLVLPLYISAIIAILLTLFYRIEIGIFFLMPFLPHQNMLDVVNKFPLGKDINDLLILAMLIRWVIDKRKADENILFKTSLNIPIFLFIIWTYIEVWWGASYFGDPAPLSIADTRFVYWKNLIRIPLLYLIIVNNIKDPRHMKIIILLMIMAILLLDRNFYNIARFRDMSSYSDDAKIGGVMAALGPNELAVCLSMYAIVLVSLFSHTRDLWIKLFLFVPIGASYYCIAFLFSRSGYLATFASWIVVGILKDKKILVALVALVLFWQVLLPNAVRERIEMTKTEDGYDGTSLQRFAMWEFGLEIILSSPIFGAGINAGEFLGITADGFENRTWSSFHNAYVQQAVETGLVGLGIYLWIFVLMIIIGWRLYRSVDDWFQKGLGLGLISCVLACMAGNVAGGYWNYIGVVVYMYVLAGLVTRSLINIEQENDAALPAQDDPDETDH